MGCAELDVLEIQPGMAIPFSELEFQYVRSAGPGGQNVNKVNSNVQLRWNVLANQSLPQPVLQRLQVRYQSKLTTVGDLIITSQRFRDRGRNTADVLQKLRLLVLSVAVAPKKRVATKPTKGSKHRRLENKQRASQKKDARRGKGWE